MDDGGQGPIVERITMLTELVGGPSAFARLIGISRSTIFDYLKEGRVIPAVRLHLIAARFPCSLDWLLHGKGEAPRADAKRTLAANTPSSSGKKEPGAGKPAKQGRTPWQVRHASLTSTHGAARESHSEKKAERVLDLMKMHDPETIEKVLGPELVSLVLAGKAIPRDRVLCELAEALGVKTTWLLGLEE